MSFILFSLNSVHCFILCTLCNISLFVINLNAVSRAIAYSPVAYGQYNNYVIISTIIQNKMNPSVIIPGC